MASVPTTHPLHTKRYLLPTNAIEKLLNSIVQWLDMLVPGAFVYGYSRIGKSSAIDFIRGRLNDILERPLPIFSITGAEERHNASPAVYWRTFLEDIGSEWASVGSAADKRRRVIQRLHAGCVQYNSPRLLLFVDDAQWHGAKDFAKLVDLHTQLDRRQIDLVVILVGQDELKDKPQAIGGSSKWPIVGRFLQEPFCFHGCDLEDDCMRILRAYDYDTEYPNGSGVSYTQAALPIAWKTDFRLEGIHAAFTIALAEARLEATGGIDIAEYPMQVITRAINGLLMEFALTDEAGFAPSHAVLKSGIKRYSGGLLAVQYDIE